MEKLNKMVGTKQEIDFTSETSYDLNGTDALDSNILFISFKLDEIKTQIDLLPEGEGKLNALAHLENARKQLKVPILQFHGNFQAGQKKGQAPAVSEIKMCEMQQKFHR